jgi:hypothetical protein
MGKALVLTVLAVVLQVGVAWAQPLETRDFEVLRNGERIGHHRVTIRQYGDETQVSIDIQLRVAFGPLTLYRYIHEAEEVWRGDRLMRLRSTTDNDGTAESLEAVADADGLAVAGSRFTGRLPPETMPTSYWRSDFAYRRPIMDSQNGRVLDLETRAQGVDTASLQRDEIPVRGYRLTGDIDLTLWYDRAGRWIRAAFPAKDGSRIDYRLR